jgi:hypothetical protein
MLDQLEQRYRGSLSEPLDELLHRAISFAGILVLSVLVGLASSLASAHSRLWFGLVSIAFLPAFLIIGSISPAAGAFLLTFCQMLEPFEFDAQILTVSIGTCALLAFLLTGFRGAEVALLRSGALFFLLHIVSCYVLSHLLQLWYADSASVMRSLITSLSFALFWLAGVLASSTTGRSGLAMGASGALLILGLLGIMSSLGLIPTPDRISASRDILGLTSPFQRSYGIDIGFVSVAVLTPLAIPYLLWQSFKHPNSGIRALSVLGLVGIFLASLMVFQARSMLIEQVVALTIAIMLLMRSLIVTSVLGAILVVCGLFAVPQLLNTDRISSELRSESYLVSLNIIENNPRILLTGTSRDRALQVIEEESKWGHLAPRAPIHNVFLMETLTGGLLASGSLALLFVVPLIGALKSMMTTNMNEERVFLIILMSAMLLIEVSINPAEANIAGLWLTLGVMARLSLLGERQELDATWDRTTTVLREQGN